MSAQIGKPKPPRSLRTTLAIAFAALSLFFLLIVSGLQTALTIRTQREMIAREQRLIAREAADVVALFIEEKISTLEAAAKSIDPIYTSKEEQKTILSRLLGLDPTFRQAVLLDWRRRELTKVSRVSQAASGQLIQHTESDFLLQVQEKGQYIGPVYVDEVTNTPMVVLAVATTNVLGEFRGVLMAEVNLMFMWELVDRLRVGETGRAYVVDRQGNLIAFSDISRVLRGENVAQLHEVAEFIRSPLPLDETLADIARGITGDIVVSTFVPLGTPDWAVMTELPIGEAYRSIIRTAVIAGLLILGLATIAWGGGSYLARRLSAPLLNLTTVAGRIAGGEIHLQAEREGSAEVVGLADAFNHMTAQLRELIGTLEQRVADRTRNLRAAAEVARFATAMLEPRELLQRTVEFIRDRFDLYYVGIFLLDETERWAVLRAGTGEAGRRMLAQGHRLEVGGQSMIGQCIAGGEARIALDVGEEAVRFDNPLLPATRSEMALPLRSRGRVIGAMTVQSTQEAAFDEADIAVMQTMADQVAVAIDNARLFTELQSALEAERRAYGEISRRAWAEMLRAQTRWGYRYAHNVLAPVESDWDALMLQAAQVGRAVLGDGDERSTLAVPVRVRDQVVSVLKFHKSEPGEEWTADEIALMEALAEQLGLALESARLYHEAQRRAAQEQMVAEITARLRASLDPDTVLKTTVRELGRALRARWTAVEITGPATTGANPGTPTRRETDDHFLG